MSVIQNRLEKNERRLAPWAKRKEIEAYRLYDLDIPEYPFLLDRYKDHFVFYDRSNDRFERDRLHIQEAIRAIQDLYRPQPGRLIIKTREKQKGLLQYEKLDDQGHFFEIQEGPLRFAVNLRDYLDTGLFLDHRPLRERLFATARGLRVLNLFCYTGSLSVAAAKAGAEVTSYDLSQNYLDWAKRNFELNGLDASLHRFFRADVMQALSTPATNHYDLVLLDPPTFSNSKKMLRDFEVERDQDFLIDNCMKRLSPKGLLIFSTNKRKFKLNERILSQYQVKDISKDSIPFDFHDSSIHHCFEIRGK